MSPGSFSTRSASSMKMKGFLALALNVLLHELLQPVEAFQLLGGGGSGGLGAGLGARPHRLLEALHIADEALLRDELAGLQVVPLREVAPPR